MLLPSVSSVCGVDISPMQQLSDGMVPEAANKQDSRADSNGSYIYGKWYCVCNLIAKCRTITKEDSPHKGEKLWLCPKNQDATDQCNFWLLDKEEYAARELRQQPGPPPPQPASERPEAPKTPPRKRQRSNRDTEVDPSITPFSLAKRNCVSRKEMNQNQVIELDSDPNDDLYDRDNQPIHQPISDAKQSKTVTFVTPDSSPNEDVHVQEKVQPVSSFISRLQGRPTELPTPESDSKFQPDALLSSQTRARQTSPTPSPRRRPRMAEALTQAILRHIRADGLQLKESTVSEIRHEINLEFNLSEARLQSYEKRDVEQKRRIDELSDLAEGWVGGLGAWDLDEGGS